MVVHNFHISNPLFCPNKTHPPLFIDANTVLALAVSGQPFQLVARRATQKLQCGCGIQLCQLAFCYGLDVGKLAGSSTGEQALRFLTFERKYGHAGKFYTVYR